METTFRVERSRLVRRVALAVVLATALTGILVSITVWRASWVMDRLLGDWAPRTLTQQSGGVYRLALGAAHVDLRLRRVTLDSISVTTDSIANAARAAGPLADVRLRMRGCAIAGVGIFTLIRGGGLLATSFGCDTGRVEVHVPRGLGVRATAPAPPRALADASHRKPFLVLRDQLRLPSYAPRLRISLVAFPRLAFDIHLPRGDANEVRLQLEQLQWRMSDVIIDPTDTAAAGRPLFSSGVELEAANFAAGTIDRTATRVAMLRASLTDSTVEIGGIDVAPTVTDAEFRAAERYRRSLIRLHVGHVMARGVDFGALVLGLGIRAQSVAVDSVRMTIADDKRRPQNPVQRERRTVQQWVADLNTSVAIDTIFVQRSEVSYSEQRPDHGAPGTIRFSQVRATAVNARHTHGRHDGADTMQVMIAARLQDTAPLLIHAEVPLDAAAFDLGVQGTLGAMPAAALNEFFEVIFPFRFSRGEVAGIAFNAAVTNGRARGRVTPRFSNLSVSITGTGAQGILGYGGMLGGAARGVVSFVANQLKIREQNPSDGPNGVPISAPIDHVFARTETLPAFLWAGIRDGLLDVMTK